MFNNRSTPLEKSQSPSSQFTVLGQHYDELMDIVPYSSWVEYVQLLFSIIEAKPNRVLDCACGTGNVSFELAQYGYDVTGVDISHAMIEAAQEKSEISLTPVRFIQADLTDFVLGETFDAATCLYDSFNYILEPEKLESAFGQIANHIETNGAFVFDMNTPYAFEANLFTQRSRDPRKKLHYDWRANFDRSTRICDVTMLFERRDENGEIEKFSEVHRERAYALSEVTAMLVRSGWQLIKVYDAYTLNPPHDRSERWYFVARKL